MYKRAISLGIAVLLGATALVAPVQAASALDLKPYVSDNKYGFTDGSKRITAPIYDTFSNENNVLVVTKEGKQGVIDAKTGAELIPAVWDLIEVPDRKNIAILHKGSAVQYFTFSTKTLSKTVFKQAWNIFLSEKHSSVVRLGGETSMLLDSDGTVLIPPTKGEIRFVDWKDEKSENAMRDSTRYPIVVTDKELTMYDPETVKPLFTVPGVKLAGPGNEIPTVSYLEVVRNGKTGLVNRDGSIALEPVYNEVRVLNGAFAEIHGPKGVGLLMGSKIVLEPNYEEVGALPYPANGYYGRKGDVVTYYTGDANNSFSLKQGADYVYGGSNGIYLLGKDASSGLYGVKSFTGETVVPFVYPGLEGVPAIFVLVRKDGKKGVLVQREKLVAEPEVWFDSYVTMGSYGMLALTDGKKLALYSQAKGLLVPFQEGLQIRYDSAHNAVLVTTPDNKTREYREYDVPADSNESTPLPEEKPDITQPKRERLNDHLTTSYIRDNGYTILDTASGQPISDQVYKTVGMEDRLVLATIDDDYDVYTETGELVTKEYRLSGKIADPMSGPTILVKAGDSYYGLAVQKDGLGTALVQITGNQMTVLSDFIYSSMLPFPAITTDGVLVKLTRQDGTSDFCLFALNGALTKVEQVEDFAISGKLLFLKKQGAWNLYDNKAKQLTTGNYKSLAQPAYSLERTAHIIFQDAQTGLYGLMNRDGTVIAAAKYDSLRFYDYAFTQITASESDPSWFVFTTGTQFGYLDQDGKEVFATALYSKPPKVTNTAIKAGALPTYDSLMHDEAAQLIDYGKPYRLGQGDIEQQFYGHVALYLNLPQDSDKEAIISALLDKGILPSTRQGSAFTNADFFALAYYMVNGKPNQTLNAQQLFNWAYERELYYERGGHDFTNPFSDYDYFFMNKLLLAKQANVQLKPKTLSFETLTDQQRNMLLPLIQVNGVPYDKLPVPLTRAYLDPQLKKLIAEYNKAAAQLLQAYTKARL